MDELTGRTLGEFRVLDKIGEGGFGAVYRARQAQLERDAVIKVLHTQHLASTAATDRFLQEARLASRLDHPYAAHVYAFGIEPDGLLWIAMEMVRGTPLSDYLRVNGPLVLERFVPLLEKLCEVIQSAHEAGIVHRDIKPANVMIIARSGRLLPKLLDFGIAKLRVDGSPYDDPFADTSLLPFRGDVLDQETIPGVKQQGGRRIAAPARHDLTGRGAVMGSPKYMAPEQWADAGAVTAAADIYAIGVMAYEVLTGRLPFDGVTVAELAVRHTSGAIPRVPPSLPPALDQVFAKALAKRPTERYASALDLFTAFRDVLGVAEHLEEIPHLDELIRRRFLADAPQPIAEAVFAATAARDARQARDALSAIPAILARWLGVLALAARSKLRKLQDGMEIQDAIRDLGLGKVEVANWLTLLRAVGRRHASAPDLHPIPELILFAAHSDGASGPGLAAYEDIQSSHIHIAELVGDDARIAERVRALVDKVGALLRAAEFVCSYKVWVAGDDGQMAIWSGTRTGQRSRREVRREFIVGHPVLVDDSGAPVVDLHPLVQLASPAPGVAPELFMYNGRDAKDARLVALPSGFELHDSIVERWIREQLNAGLELSQSNALERAPYLGLSAFTADDARFYYGRESTVDAVVNRLKIQTFLTIAGPSGSGKSSFVQAGVISALPSWRSVVIRPGSHPLVALATRLQSVGIGGADLPLDIGGSPEQLGALARTNAASTGPLVVIIDQFEELFTLAKNPRVRHAFAAALAALSRSPEDNVRVIITLRDDFLVAAQGLPPLRDRITQGLQLLTTPDKDDLERILVEPARRVGYEFEDRDLPARMVAEIQDHPGALALLSFTAARLWEERDRHFRRLLTDSYERLGGVAGALARHAESILEHSSAREQKMIREAFRHLVTAEGTRGVMTRHELSTVIGEGADLIIEKLVNSRLLVAREGEGEEQIEVVHEALIVAWPRLVTWRREDAEVSWIRDQLREAARQWKARGRPSAMLWRDEVLKDLERWRSRYGSKLTTAERDFADASRGAGRRSRLARVVTLALIPVIAGSVYLTVNRQKRAEFRARAEERASEAATLLTQARGHVRTSDSLRSRAYASYDQGKWQDAEPQWQLALSHMRDADQLLGRASQALEAALKIDVEAAVASRLLADVVFDRVLVAEVVDERRVPEYLERLALYDGDGTRRQRLQVPASLSISTAPRAAVTIAPISSDAAGFKRVGPPRTVGVTPLSEIILAPGSYQVVATSSSTAPATLPLVIARGERREITLQLIRAEAIPNGFIYIPGGQFEVGTRDEGMRTGFLGTVPLHRTQTGPFLIARYETTYADWIAWLETLPPRDRAERAPHVGKGMNNSMELIKDVDGWRLTIQPASRTYSAHARTPITYSGRDRRAQQDWLRFPVGGVSCRDVEAYTAWLRTTNRVPGARLCTELEWERAARGADDREYPHGDKLNPDDANYDATYGKHSDAFGPDEVGSHPASVSPFGTHDQSGNVWEWTTSSYVAGDCVARGGGYYMTSKSARVTNREVTDADARDAQLGARVCADLAP